MMCTLMKKVKGGLHLGEALAGEVDQRPSDCQGGSKVPFAETFHISESYIAIFCRFNERSGIENVR